MQTRHLRAKSASDARREAVAQDVFDHNEPTVHDLRAKGASDSEAAYADDVRANFSGEVTLGKDLTRLTLP